MLQDKSITSNFSLFHANARSLPMILDNLTTNLSTLHFTFNIIAITETWATLDNESLLHIASFNRVLKNQPSGRGGGVTLFI